MIFAYIWALFVLFLTGVGLKRLFEESLFDWYDKTMFATIYIIFGAMFAIFPVIFVLEHQSPILTTLKKDSWECISTHQERTYTGKVWVMQTVCDAYARK